MRKTKTLTFKNNTVPVKVSSERHRIKCILCLHKETFKSTRRLNPLEAWPHSGPALLASQSSVLEISPMYPCCMTSMTPHKLCRAVESGPVAGSHRVDLCQHLVADWAWRLLVLVEGGETPDSCWQYHRSYPACHFTHESLEHEIRAGREGWTAWYLLTWG